MSTKIDPRIRRTRDALGDALVALMQERPFESLTVQDVLDRAGVGRSTFYVHYRDKDDLFASDVDEFWAGMANAKVQPPRIAPVRELLQHAAGMSHFIDALRSAGKHHEVFELGQLHFARAIGRRLSRADRAVHLMKAQRDALAFAQAGAILALLDWWLSHGQPMPPADADELFHRAFWSGVESLR